MNWAEGFRRLSLVFLVPLILLVILMVAVKFTLEVVQVAGWVSDNPGTVAIAGALAVGGYLVVRWVVLGFREPGS